MLRPLSDHVEEARLRLLKAGIRADEARLDAELLARHVLGWDRARFIAYRRQVLTETDAASYSQLVARRERHEPTAYILGSREFYGRTFEVNRDVLIPRPETELLVETVLALAASANAEAAGPLTIADVGTGSGCIGVTLAAELPTARVVALDVSKNALTVARRNATAHGVAERMVFVERDLRKGLASEETQGAGLTDVGRFDIIVSNPPYVPAPQASSLDRQVRDFEPSLALYGGEDGLDLVRALIGVAAPVLRGHGWLVFEIGTGQPDATAGIVSAAGLEFVRTVPDLQGIPRVVVAHQPRRMPTTAPSSGLD